jgi:hypothetical protein
VQVKSQEEREALATEFERHVVEEDRILQEYHALSDKLPEGPLSVVVNHIVTDEEMHHFLLRTLAEWMRETPSEAEVLGDVGPDREALLRNTRALMGHEQETIEACRALGERLTGEEGELFRGIIDAISLDSQKHHRLLGLVERLVEGGQG